jgi:L-ascorbate metabolism protein UlaG (beta-lactamase superfamily)
LTARTRFTLLTLAVATATWGCVRETPGDASEAPVSTFQSADVGPMAGAGDGSAAAVSDAESGEAPPAGEEPPIPRDSALIAYLANEGVMVVASGRTVLIDALFREGVRGYATVNDRMLEAMERGIGAFAGVDLVLASHHHPDHFDASAVLSHLRNNEIARFVSTRQAVSRLESVTRGSSQAASGDPVFERAMGVFPEEGQSTVLSFDNIQLRVLNLHHGQREDPVENLGLLLDMGGFKVLHVGDTEASVEEFAVYGLAEEGIHVALLPYWKLLEAEGPRLVREIGATHVVAIHVPGPSAPADWFGAAGSRLGLVSELDQIVPGVIVFEEPGETHRLGYWPTTDQ